MGNIDQKVTLQPKVSNYKMRLLIFATLLFFVVISGMVGYMLGERAGQNKTACNQQTRLPAAPTPTLTKLVMSPTTEPTAAAITNLSPLPTVGMAIADWKTYSSSDGRYSFQYPPGWLKAEGMLNGGETGVDVSGAEGDFGIVIPSMPFLTCESNTQQVQLKGKSITTCHQINPNGSETWNAMMVQQPSSAKKFRIQATAATPAQNNRALLLQIFSTLTIK